MLKKLKDKLKTLASDKFLRSAGVLAGGAVAGRLITFIFLPFITRLYSPEDYSALAFYIGALTIISAVSCLRFEVAIPVSKEDDEAVNLLAVSIFSGLFFSIALTIVILFSSSEFLNSFAPMSFHNYWFMFPLGVLFFSLYAALQYWAARKKRFRSIAITRISQAMTGSIASLIIGWIGLTPFGLLLGNMLNTSAGALRLARDFYVHDRAILRSISLRGVCKTVRLYIRYPKYLAPEALANSAGTQLPIVILAALAIGNDAGQLLLAMQVMLAPMALVGVSIGKVYLANGGEAYRAGTLKEFTLDVQSKLIRLGLGPTILVGVLAPILFPFFFGPQWTRAGVFVLWMTPWIALQLLSSPISACFHISGKQKSALTLQTAGFALRLGSIGLAALFYENSQVAWFIAASTAFYLVFLISEYRILQINHIDVKHLFLSTGLYLLPFCIIAAVITMYL